MSSRRLTASAIAACLALGATALPGAASATPAPGSLPGLPQPVAARAGAAWLGGQVNGTGFIPTSGTANPDYSATAQAVLALAAASTDLSQARSALGYLAAHVDQYVVQSGADGPAQLALLTLDAVALGVDPHAFGGTNLVARLLATQQATGPDAGLFGTEAQVPNYLAGSYPQGLALAALAAVGVTATAATRAGSTWLVGQQCPSGGWTVRSTSVDVCSDPPPAFDGPDTNSTAVAIEGLVAQRALTPTVTAGAVAFLGGAQDADAGWSYLPNTVSSPQVSDPDSTAFVIQALLALGRSPAAAPYVRGANNPVSILLSFQLPSGAFAVTSPPAPPDVIATYQAVPALAGLAVPFGPAGHGYWLVGSDGGIFAYGNAAFYGSLANTPLTKPIVGIAPSADGHGYWLVAADGGIFAYGNAAFYGSLGNTPLTKPIVGIAPTPDGHGYWLVAADGGIFAYGNAAFYGSLGNTPLTKPIVGIAPTPDGHGYWLVAADGGIFAYGNAAFYGSLGNTPLTKPIVGIAPTPDGHGYWLVAADGGIFAYGNAAFYGSLGNTPLRKPIVGIARSADGHGYWLVAADGGIFAYGNAAFYGSLGNTPPRKPVVGMATGRM